MKILFIGDIYGEPGRRILLQNIEKLKTEYKPNIILANAENSAHGRALLKNLQRFMNAGINLLTMEPHFGNMQIYELFEDENINIIRPINYSNVSGKGYKVIKYNDQKS